MSIQDKITRLQNAKADIADAITAQGGTVNEGDGFEEFANDIGTIQTGGDLESFIAGTSTSVTYEGEIVRDCAFAGMSDLEEVNLPNALYIGRDAFANHYYYSDSEISDPSSGDLAFNNNSLTTVNMPKVTNIMQSAFEECEGLTSIDLPNTLIRIGNQAFGNSGLESIVIPDSVLYIDHRAFMGCTHLAALTLSNGITSISDNAFYGCEALTTLTIPDSVTSIGSNAFSNCYALTTLSIPNSVTSIVGHAFSGCEALTTIDMTAFEFTDSVPILNISAFSGININAKFYFKDQATLDNFAAAATWSTYSSKFTTDPVPTPSE